MGVITTGVLLFILLFLQKFHDLWYKGKMSKPELKNVMVWPVIIQLKWFLFGVHRIRNAKVTSFGVMVCI